MLRPQPTFAPLAPALPAAPDPELPALTRQQRRRLNFIKAERLSPSEASEFFPDTYDPGPEYDDEGRGIPLPTENS